jgi:hypothetical protein
VRGCKNPRLEEAWLVGRPASRCEDGSTRTFFPKKGSRLPSPTSVPQAYLHHICLNALVKGIIRPETREQLLTIVDRLQESYGIQARILGGTELSLILREPTVRDTPVLDTTKIHAKTIVAESFLTIASAARTSNCGTTFRSLVPSEKLPECRTTVAVLRLFFWGQFGKGLLNLRKVKQRIVAKAIGSTRTIQNRPFNLSAENLQSLSVACDGNHTYESTGALAGRNILQFAEQTRVIGFVVGVVIHQVWRSGCEARRMDARSTLERVNFEPGIIGQDHLARNFTAVSLRLFSRILFESQAIFDHGRQRGEVWNRRDLNAKPRRGAGEVAQLARVRGRDEDVIHQLPARFAASLVAVVLPNDI